MPFPTAAGLQTPWIDFWRRWDIDESIALRPGTRSYNGKRERGFADLIRVETPAIPLADRYDGFTEVDLCLDDDHAYMKQKMLPM